VERGDILQATARKTGWKGIIAICIVRNPEKRGQMTSIRTIGGDAAGDTP
jgi:hypothetical protein